MTDAELHTLSQRNDVVLACADGTIPHLYGRKAFAYGQPMSDSNTWTDWIRRNGGWLRWIEDQNLDGLMIDTPFIDFDAFRYVAIMNDLHPLPVCPNFGDFGTWTMTAPAAPGYAEISKILQSAPWHFVQNAYDVSRHTEARWRDLKSAANVRLAAGKTLVLGLYDPVPTNTSTIRTELGVIEPGTLMGANNPMLAALLSQSFEHPNLLWYYCSDANSQSIDAQWNSYWGLAR
jgi:hypothetical protein